MSFRLSCILFHMLVGLVCGTGLAHATDHSGIVEDFDHWSAYDNPHIINGTVTVAEGGHLLIGPGVVVQSRQDCQLTIEGQLTVDGDPGNEVLFTTEPGFNSPTYAITFGTSGSGNAQDCIVESASVGINLASSAGQVTLFRTTVRDCGTGVRHGGGVLQLESTTLRDNSYGLTCWNVAPQFLDGAVMIIDNSIGIRFVDVPNLNLTTPLTVSNSTSRGIWMQNCPLPIVDNVTLTGNANYGAFVFENCGDFLLGAGNVIGGAGLENAWPVTLELGSYPAAACVVPASGNENNDIRVDGGVSSANGSWRKLPGVDYVLTAAEVIVSAGGTLTVEPGVTVRHEYAYSPSMSIRGTLIAEGAPGQAILFSRESSGRWQGLIFEDAGSGSLSHCIIEQASTCVATETNATGTVTITDTQLRDSSTGLRMEGGSVSLGSTTISASGSYGIDCDDVVPTFLDTDNTITGGQYGLHISDVPDLELTTTLMITGATIAGVRLFNCMDPLVDNLIVTDCAGTYGALYLDRCGDITLGSGNTIGGSGQENSWPLSISAGSYPTAGCTIPATGNTNNDIQILGGTSTRSGIWRKFPDLDYVIHGTGPVIAEGTSLTIEPSVEVRLADESSDLDVRGELIAAGEPGQEIVFTSHDATTWAGLDFTLAGSATLTHCLIEHATNGIRLDGTGTVFLADCTLRNGATGIRATSGTVTLHRTRITGNSEYGVYLYGDGTCIFGLSPDQWNDILDNGAELAGRALRNGDNDIDTPYVWWGTVDPMEIAESIYDGNDNANLGLVDFTPYCNAEHGAVSVTGVESIDPSLEIPARFGLAQAVPNPFNPATLLRFDTTRPSHVRLSIHDLTGRTVATLADGPLAAGKHQHRWTGCDDRGRSLPSGVYFSRLESAEGVLTRKLTLVR